MNDRLSQPAEGQTSEVGRLDPLCIATLQTLLIDAVQKANSGQPGTPMGAALIAYCLWQRFLRYDAEDPEWPDRDRFVLSAGHASALLYSLLYWCGVKSADRAAVTLEDLQTFRQAGSRCTVHPEQGWAAGVETTTGPLGQGVATSVGMAIAQAWLAATYNRPGHVLFDHRVFALCSDGDMMEGISAEAASLAGHLKRSRLCWIYDSNHISIEGATALTFTEDVGARFEACGWHVLRVADANDLAALVCRLQAFVDTQDRPTLVIVQNPSGYGAPHKQDTKEAHREPLGADEVRQAKQFYGFDPDVQFAVPGGVQAHFSAQFGQRGSRAREARNARLASYLAQFPELTAQLQRMQHRALPPGWDSALPVLPADSKGLATREASGKVLAAMAQQVPWLLGGAADLAPSTKTALGHAGKFEPPAGYGGRNLHFGIREHAICAIASGLALAGLHPFAASFFIFTDYCRGAIRLSAMMGLPVIYIWTHDSISMGEDGPTHQPVAQLASFRAMPGMVLLRPADANEVVEAWRVVLQLTDQPASMVRSRQALPTLDRRKYASASGVARGAYVLADAQGGKPDVLLATGSEVALRIGAYEQLKGEGIRARVVSMPSWELFESQSAEYRDSVLPHDITARVPVEAASPLGWERHVGQRGTIIGMRSFGILAPGKVAEAHFGFDVALTYADWHREFAALAHLALAKGQMLKAAYHVRSAEFFLPAGDPQRQPMREEFVQLTRDHYGVKPNDQHQVPYAGGPVHGFLPVYRFTPADTKGVVLFCAGFDSYLEELFLFFFWLRDAGHDVVAFECPSQGGALFDAGLPMTLEWEKPVAAVLNHLHPVTDCAPVHTGRVGSEPLSSRQLWVGTSGDHGLARRAIDKAATGLTIWSLRSIRLPANRPRPQC